MMKAKNTTDDNQGFDVPNLTEAHAVIDRARLRNAPKERAARLAALKARQK